MPSLMKLKDAIYSSECRAFMERISGLEAGTLTNEVDCAANCHAKGCHLLCHDDVIGTRKISYIIYLTDEMPKWKDEDGGRLELYDAIVPTTEKRKKKDESTDDGDDGSGGKVVSNNDDGTSRRVPAAIPCKTILPEFNTMAYFAVEPGVSFHSVQEVFVTDTPRLSIQGWYHANDTPCRIENATLQRLKTKSNGSDGVGGEDTEGVFEPLVTTAAPSGECAAASAESSNGSGNHIDNIDYELNVVDRSFLGKYINSTYLTIKSMNEIRDRFEEESSVKLRHFLTDEWIAAIDNTSSKDDARDKLGMDRPALDYRVGVTDTNHWRLVGPAHKQRFLEYNDNSNGDDNIDDNNVTTGSSLGYLRYTLFQSAAFGRWLGYITSLGTPKGIRGRIRRFRPGLDYTVAHYGVLTTHSVLDATLCFCAGDGKQCAYDEETADLLGSDEDAIWESGDVGGFECYIAATEDDDNGGDNAAGPDAEYDEEDDTKLLSVSASNNTLSLVYRDPGTMRFVKYVGSGAPSSRWDIALEYEVNSLGDTDDELSENGIS